MTNFERGGNNLTSEQKALNWLQTAREHLMDDEGADSEERIHYAAFLEAVENLLTHLPPLTEEIARMYDANQASRTGIDITGLQITTLSIAMNRLIDDLST